jgi:hypothetical protein
MIFDVDNHPVAYVLLMKTLAERSAHALGGHGMNTELTASMAWLIGFCVLAEAAGSVLQAGRESYRFAQGHDEADDLAGRGIELVAWTLVLEHVPLSLHPKKLRAVYKAEQFLS